MMLEEGTKNYSTEEISLQLDEIGSTISFNGSDRQSTIYISSLVENIDKTLQVLDEKLFNPGFRKDDFKRVKKQYRESINNSKKSAINYLGSTAAKQKMYGKSIRGVTETVKSIDKLKLDDVENFYNKQYNSSLASIVIVGDMPQSEIVPKLDFLNKWEGSDIAINRDLPKEDINGRQIYIVHKPWTTINDNDRSSWA